MLKLKSERPCLFTEETVIPQLAFSLGYTQTTDYWLVVTNLRHMILILNMFFGFKGSVSGFGLPRYVGLKLSHGIVMSAAEVWKSYSQLIVLLSLPSGRLGRV